MWRRRRSSLELPRADPEDIADVRDRVVTWTCSAMSGHAMASLPRGQRAVLVLRYFDDLSEAEAATTSVCSIGTVKSQAARASASLRANTEVRDLIGAKEVTP